MADEIKQENTGVVEAVVPAPEAVSPEAAPVDRNRRGANRGGPRRGGKKPEPYKGKGIRYDGEVIRRKQGKKAA